MNNFSLLFLGGAAVTYGGLLFSDHESSDEALPVSITAMCVGTLLLLAGCYRSCHTPATNRAMPVVVPKDWRVGADGRCYGSVGGQAVVLSAESLQAGREHAQTELRTAAHSRRTVPRCFVSFR